MGCPFNFNEFKEKKGAVAQTLLLQIDVLIYLKEINTVNLFVRRSFSEHLMSWIDDAASRL
jgi:sarcosine oxidase subunit gamma